MGVEEQGVIRGIFCIDWEGIDKFDTENTLNILNMVIPNSDAFYLYGSNSYSIKLAQQRGQEQEIKGKTLYMIADDPDIIHWVSFNKKWEKVFFAIKPFLFPHIMLSDFHSADLV